MIFFCVISDQMGEVTTHTGIFLYSFVIYFVRSFAFMFSNIRVALVEGKEGRVRGEIGKIEFMVNDFTLGK